ncbi:hypothetical protein [Hydrogenobacter thermophilus]|uniref:hypothetical protein n=1 Tax=Hydrogenobacter thermophilus TaxID=940 RepID=UPI0030F4D1C0
MKGWLVALLLMLLSLEGGISLAHKHEDGKLHLDCSVCVFQASQQVEANPSLEPQRADFLVFYLDQTHSLPKPRQVASKHTLPRAPPA